MARRNTPPTDPVPGAQPPAERRVVVVGPIDGDAIELLCDRLRLLIEGGCPDLVASEVGVDIDVHVDADADVATLDALARLQLTARRLGSSIRLCHPRPELADLLALAGLREVFPTSPESAPEDGRQVEQAEQAPGDEGGDSRDPTA
jgi:STAS domain